MSTAPAGGMAALRREAGAEAERLGSLLRAAGWRVVCAESCTGGWIAKLLTDSAGSSAWFEHGVVAYSNEAKQELLAVSSQTLQRHGAVSAEAVTEMARGALRLGRGRAQAALAVSGVAGPSGGSAGKPVGTVWLGWALADPSLPPATPVTRCWRFAGDRERVRLRAAAAALAGLAALLQGRQPDVPAAG